MPKGIFPRTRTDPIKRFWSKVIIGSEDECWIYTGGYDKDGYGVFATGGTSATTKAHRFSYGLHFGPIPYGLYVCHHCDNPPCVNPKHFFLGTNRDNQIDARDKGFLPMGEEWKKTHANAMKQGQEHPRAKLTNEQIQEIISLKGKFSQEAIGRKFGVAQAHISRILLKQSWRHITT
jgi:hypothetical protein